MESGREDLIRERFAGRFAAEPSVALARDRPPRDCRVTAPDLRRKVFRHATTGVRPTHSRSRSGQARADLPLPEPTIWTVATATPRIQQVWPGGKRRSGVLRHRWKSR